MKKLAFTVAAAALLSACTPMPPLNFSVPNVGYSTHKLDAEMKSMTVTLARPDEATGKVPAGMEGIVPALWQTSLQESLNKMAIFKDDAPEKVNLSVKVLKLDPPGAGFSMTTNVEARYELQNRANGDIIYSQNIASSGTVPADYAFAGIVRMRESVNRAVQNNVSLFLQALETVDLKKPMFPTQAAAK
ncbi:UDP-N-acetylglucosamine acyltransferase [Paraburkholderia sp. RP-4-7]|uniref:UDP-N-acetylglucosamine acyltransferase n=1 Tax=Paraburkholderia polaris TaxID=2728848 RepID=A0A848ITX7_9BURK|nr:UDP-N-acetylglucosamine acyltransferase [Paraburkholderia polaris]NMM04543.1 UDP-N-acetylglucosamine acyltransferase [Paraburkholderia polaris]